MSLLGTPDNVLFHNYKEHPQQKQDQGCTHLSYTPKNSSLLAQAKLE